MGVAVESVAASWPRCESGQGAQRVRWRRLEVVADKLPRNWLWTPHCIVTWIQTSLWGGAQKEGVDTGFFGCLGRTWTIVGRDQVVPDFVFQSKVRNPNVEATGRTSLEVVLGRNVDVHSGSSVHCSLFHATWRRRSTGMFPPLCCSHEDPSLFRTSTAVVETEGIARYGCIEAHTLLLAKLPPLAGCAGASSVCVASLEDFTVSVFVQNSSCIAQ